MKRWSLHQSGVFFLLNAFDLVSNVDQGLRKD